MNNSNFSGLSQPQNQQSYMDLHGLQNIRKAGAEDKGEGLRQVAQQFESMFIQMMLKSMRSANEVFGKDNPLNTSESKHYQDMYDNQLSLSMSGKNLGIADALYRQLERNYIGSQADEDGTDGKAITMPENGYKLDESKSYKLNDPSSSAGLSINTTSLNPSSGYVFDTRHSGLTPAAVIKSNGIHQNKPASQDLISSINNPQDFIRIMEPYAKKAAETLGVDHKLLIAQSALETGWGKHIIHDSKGQPSFNLFNIKADSRWEGGSVGVPTLEYVNGVPQRENAQFRRYDSIEQSFNDYLKFLEQPRYEKALAAAGNAQQFSHELQQAGYATDPKYSEKINSIYRVVKDNILGNPSEGNHK